MKKDFAIVVMAATMLLCVLMVPPGVGNENTTAPNEQVCGYPSMVDWIISGAIANETRVSKLELPISIAATGDFAGRIAFSSERDGIREIYVMDADGTNVTRLTYNSALDSNPEWHPSGSEIAFYSDRDGDFEIYVMDAEGTNVTQLTYNTNKDGNNCWSPDGNKIAFCSDRDGDFEIYVMDAEGTNVTQLTYNTAVDTIPHWSPDGSKIAFCSDRDGDYEIYVMDADGMNQEQLTYNNETDIPGEWSPDGNKILFCSNCDGDMFLDIYIMDVDGTNVEQLTTKRDGHEYFDFDPAWALGGKKILFVSGTSDLARDFEIYVMDADGTNLTQLTTNTANDWEPDWTPPVCELPEACLQYDADYNCVIERYEVINAINDYFDDVITREQLITVINATSR